MTISHSQDFGRIVLPVPQEKWTPEYQRALNHRIEELIKERAAVDQLAPYGGVPHVQVTGTNAAFPVPTGATGTVLPFNSILTTTAVNVINFNTGTFAYRMTYSMNTIMFFRVRHEAAGGGDVDVIMTLLVNGTPVESYGYTARNDNVFDISDTFFPIVPVSALNLPIVLTLQHSSNQPLLVDMTKSKWVFMQLTPNPKYKAIIERY